MRIYSLTLILGALLFQSVALSASSSGGSSGKNFVFLEAGAYAYNLKERFSVPSGFDKSVSSVEGYFRIHSGFSLGKGWHFEPSFGTMLPMRDGIDGTNTAFDSHFAFQLGIPLFSFLSFRIGPGIEWVWLLSKQSDVVLNNGTSTSTFYTPTRSSHVFLFTATGGFTIRLHNRWSIFLDVYVPEVLSTARREYHASATIGFRL